MIIPMPVGPQPPPQYVRVTLEWSRKVKRQLIVTGLLLVIVSVIIAALGIPWAFFLPTGGEVGTIMLAAFLGLSVFFSLMMGGISLIGQSYVKPGWLNWTYAQGVWRSGLVLWIFSILSGVASVFFFALTIAGAMYDGVDAVRIDLETLSYLAMITLPAALSGIALLAVIRKLRV